MTPEEIRELTSLVKRNYYTASTIDRNERVTSCESIADLATAIEFFRRDLKSIVSDAVRVAVADEVAKALKGISQSEEKTATSRKASILGTDYSGKHPIGEIGTSKKYRKILFHMGVEYYEDIHGYMKISHNDYDLYIFVKGKLVECPMTFDDFNCLMEDMNRLGLPFDCLSEATIKKGKVRHKLDDVPFHYSECRELLKEYGAEYLDDITGFRYSPVIGLPRQIKIKGTFRILKNKFFYDLEGVMKSYNVPFKYIIEQ